MSKILLIKPRFLGLNLQAITQPMGLLYIGAMLKKNGHEPLIHDCRRDYKNLHILKKTISNWKPDFIGISIIITELEQTKNIMGIIRDTLPDVPVIFGGPWPSANPQKAVKQFGADFVVLGEGELVFPELIHAINNGLPVESIPGTASLFDGQVKINPGVQLTENELNALPFPAWDLLDHRLYAKTFSQAVVGSRSYMAIVTSRGCPFKCAYCHNTMGKVFRKRSAESVLSEMEELRFRHGFREFEIVDDCFNLDRERMFAILKGIRDRFNDVKLHFPNGLRADMLEPEDMALFRQAGTVSAFFAIETPSRRLQKMIHKNLNTEKAFHIIEAAVREGIYTSGYFMIGFPTETYEEATATAEFAARSSLHRAVFFNPTPYEGTELADICAGICKKRIDVTNPHQMNYFANALNISAMSDRELQKVFLLANRKFYLNLKRIMSLILCHPRILSLPRYAFLALIKMLPKKRCNA